MARPRTKSITAKVRKPRSSPVHPDAIVVNANLPLYPWTVLAMRASFDTHDPQQFPVYVLGQAEVNATVVFKAREHVEFAGKSAELNHLTVTGSSPQGQPISLDFWVDDNRKLIKIAVPSQGVEAYQEGFAPSLDAKNAPRRPPVGSSEGRLIRSERFYGLAGNSSEFRRWAARRHCLPRWSAICSSILEIAETIEAISPEISPVFREPLMSLRSASLGRSHSRGARRKPRRAARNPARLL